MRVKRRKRGADGAEAGASAGEPQHREYVRVRVTLPVLAILGVGGRQVETYSVEISGGGILLAGPGTLELGDWIEVQIALTETGSPIVASGRVIRLDPEGYRAISFDSISEAGRRRLIRYVFECQRIERSKGLRPEAWHER